MLLPFRCLVPRIAFIFCSLFFLSYYASGQDNSIVKVHGGPVSGYGVAYKSPDMIVTALHVVAGRSPIKVEWHGKTVDAKIEKIYKASDLALLKLSSPLGVPPLQLYSGEPPWDETVLYWEIPPGSPVVTKKTARLEEATNLSKINARVNPPPGLENALCKDGGKPYPGLTTEVINFEEANIRKAHSGSPITYNGKIVGMIDGGAKLLDGKSCIWAIHKDDFNKLLSQGTPPPATMAACSSSGASGKNMYSGTRSDNPNLSPEEVAAAKLFEEAASKPLTIQDNSGDTLRIYNEQRMSFGEIYESLQDGNKQKIKDLFSDEVTFSEGNRLSHEDLMEEVMDMHQGNRTGASLIVPNASSIALTTDAFGNIISVASPSGLSVLSIYLSKNETPEEATAEMARFKEMLQSLGQQTEPTANNVNDYNCEPGDPYYREYIKNSTIDETTDAVLSEFTSSMTINDSDFLGVWLNVTDWKKMWNSKEERKAYYLLQSGVIFADFAIY